MIESELNKLKYPVGKYIPRENYTNSDIKWYIHIIEQFPAKLKNAIEFLSEKQLNYPYREGGWSIRQVVHHIADSHINGYVRFRLALTENSPEIKPYLEDRWAEIPDARISPVELSLPLIEALHKRWAVMLKNITPDELLKKIYHPGEKQEMTIAYLMGLYAWHCEHHLAHITSLKKRLNW